MQPLPAMVWVHNPICIRALEFQQHWELCHASFYFTIYFYSKNICIVFKRQKASAFVSESSRKWEDRPFSGTNFGAEV